MAKNIKTMVAGCNECLTFSVSKPKEPLIMTMADRPFEKISMDYGEYKQKYYLVIVDRYSCAQNKPIGSHFMKQNADFHKSISQA